MNCLCCTLCFLLRFTLSLCLLQRGAYQHALSVLYLSTNLPPRQVVRRSLLFFLLSLPSCEKSFYCRVSPNCVGRDECGDPNRNDLSTYLERDKTTSCPEMKYLTTFCFFYCGPGHAHVYIRYLCAGASQMKEHTGSCGQCRTVHEGFKPQSPCFLYGVDKN